MCWSGMWLKNSETGETLDVSNGLENSCITEVLGGNFVADTIILQKCGWSWSSTDAVELCGILDAPDLPVCGNGFLEIGEECDDGNNDETDLCANECTITYCGDGVVQSPDGFGILEECDDGNTENGDGCSSQCVTEEPSVVEICDWQDCRAGAASVSIDDSFSACRNTLNENGFEGTYYLSYTGDFTQADWNLWNNIYDAGHEIGSHTA
ncbi:DUF4215 domain-containing protein, partial [Patescibacteria group bacterium]|nr:DUF4215 domain-containing protein [Patescibacteria group bacterium]